MFEASLGYIERPCFKTILKIIKGTEHKEMMAPQKHNRLNMEKR
jgi:hypothetical protein